MTTTTTTMTGDATNGFDSLYGYERPLDGYDDDDVCSGEESGGRGGLLGEEECEVEDREWSVAVVAAATNANPHPAGSVVLDKTPGGRLLREYDSIVIASASSSSGNDDDDGMSINNDVDGGDDFDGGGEVRMKESTAASRAPPTCSRARSLISPTVTMTTTTMTMARTENPAMSTGVMG
jgi:hypothetical protein